MAPPKLKKQKASSSKSSSSKSSSKLSQIAQLEASLLPSTSSLNPLVDLLNLTTSSPEPELVHKAVYSLGRVFSALFTQNRLTYQPRFRKKRDQDDELNEQAEIDREKLVADWTKARFDEYITFLGGLLKDVELELRVCFFFFFLVFSPFLHGFFVVLTP